MDKIIDLYLTNQATRKDWQSFLVSLGIHNFSQREINVIDRTLGLVDENNQLVATGSVAGHVLKYIAVNNAGAKSGSRFNQIVTALMEVLFNQQIYHALVFTKPKYISSFQHLGFRELAHSSQAAFLESGTPDVDDYLNELPQVAHADQKKIAAIVMNANCFTLGHQHLVERAARENDFVYVFVVAADLSLFTFEERFNLVKAGCQNWHNVFVVSGNDYMVSSATFPAYFLPSSDDLIQNQTTIDVRLFKKIISPKLHITRRYVGTEPFSRTTSLYNEVLNRELEPEVRLVEVPRYQVGQNVITATRVREDIRDGNLAEIKTLVPATTMNFIQDHFSELQTRIKKGMNIDGN